MPWAIPVSVTLVGYGALWACQLPRVGPLNRWLSWWSYDIEAVALRRGINLVRWRETVERVYEVDVPGGGVRRTIFAQQFSRSFANIAITPDGSGLLIPLRDHRLGLVSTATGRVSRTLESVVDTASPSGGCRQIVGFDFGGQGVYVTFLDELEKRTKLVRWDISSNSHSLVLEVGAEVMLQSTLPHRFYQIPGDSPVFLELGGGNLPQGSNVIARVHDPSPTHWYPVDLLSAPYPFFAPSFSGDGSQVYFGCTTQGEVATSSLRNGRALTNWCPPGDCEVLQVTSDNPQHDRMVIAGRDHEHALAFLIVDLQTGRLLGSVRQPDDIATKAIYVSPGGRFLATDSFCHKVKPEQAELLIYDLQAVQQTTDER